LKEDEFAASDDLHLGGIQGGLHGGFRQVAEERDAPQLHRSGFIHAGNPAGKYSGSQTIL
jgi:hypothetical protein